MPPCSTVCRCSATRLQVQERLALADAATDKLYRDSYANMVRMVKKLYDNDITDCRRHRHGQGLCAAPRAGDL